MLRLARPYGRICAVAKRRFNLNLPGLGWLVRRIDTDATLDLDGIKFHLDHRIATSYGHLIGGASNEPETPYFVRRILDEIAEPVTLVDVGANVGDIVLHVAGHPMAARILAFEAHPIAASALRRSADLNGFHEVRVYEELVGDGRPYQFDVNERNANASGISANGANASVRLDDRLQDTTGRLIIIIDVEGAEPIVMRGALETIRRLRPLIIFEYNFISREHFDLENVSNLLGDDYSIFRLRRDGGLDRNYDESWNCVAIPRGSLFAAILTP